MDVLVALQRCRGPTEDKDTKQSNEVRVPWWSATSLNFFWSKHVLDTGATDSRWMFVGILVLVATMDL